MRATARRLLHQVDAALPSIAGESNAYLKRIFDGRLPATSENSIKSNGGRFRYASLQKPQDFVTLTRKAQLRAGAIVKRMLAYSQQTPDQDAARSAQEARTDLLVQVKQIDRLSDLLCGVIDLAELVRNVDPDPQWVQYADNAYQELCYYMNELNTHVGLYEVGCFSAHPLQYTTDL